MDKVAILMSTYNGEKYLDEQIGSILAQEGVDVTLYIRDDGSSDRTAEIIKYYCKRYHNVSFTQGENLGVGNSFMQLVYDAKDVYDYYAFADQDDIWLPEKIKMAADKIKESKRPLLYCSNQTLIDKNGIEMGIRHSKTIDSSYLQVLSNNEATGCTMVWNKALQYLISDEKRRPSKKLLKKRIHDVWIAMAASVAGEIYYDKRSFILYRQHENNVVGVRKGSIYKEWRKKIKNKELRNGRSVLAKEILIKFGDKIDSRRMKEKLQKCACYKDSISTKIMLCRDTDLMKYSNEGMLMYKVKIILNLF
ncbi:MAG: glycosyltransferase family 2 protein [Dorea sp.]|nr:glycosyltransferase family 2 protein [Dorea sp.]